MKTEDQSVSGIDIAAFKDWIADSAVPSLSLREDMLTGIERCDPRDLSEMIDIVRRAELSCLIELRDFHHNARTERQQRAEQRQAGSRRQRRMSAIVYTEVAGSWDRKIKWLQEVRRCLVEEQRRCADVGADVGVGVPVA